MSGLAGCSGVTRESRPEKYSNVELYRAATRFAFVQHALVTDCGRFATINSSLKHRKTSQTAFAQGGTYSDNLIEWDASRYCRFTKPTTHAKAMCQGCSCALMRPPCVPCLEHLI